MKRLFLLAVVGIALVGLIVYSQTKPELARVSGFVEADEIRLGSRVGGRVAAVHVEEGDEVAAGMPLVDFEAYDLRERERELQLKLAGFEAAYARYQAGYRPEEIAQAKAKLAQLQARLDLLKAGPRDQEIEAARGQLTLAEAQQKLAERTFRRVSNLVEQNTVSRQELDNAREALEASSAAVLVRQQELALLEAGTREEELREAEARVEEAKQAWQLMQEGYRAEDVEQARASRDAAQAALDALQRQKDELTIESPLDGRIESSELRPGDMVAPNAPVLSMMDLSQLWVRAYVPQNRVGLRVGQTVLVSVDAFPDEDFRGTVSFVSRRAEFTPSNVQTPEERSKQVYRIKVMLSDTRGRLRPGMTADVWLDAVGESP
ncbi:MAG: efflux RND transporter periplasmic adaptor subunit [Planctomycetales bacterium]|nr:efflux RND transporter periplasmic adaptor subunit [Planctomycetales bacterium]